MSTTAPTPRFGLIAPNGDDNIKNGDDIIRANAAALDPSSGSGGAAQYLEGTLAARPAAGTKARIYRATDRDQIFLDNGASWEPLFGQLTSARLRRAATQSIPNAADTLISWDTEDRDTDNGIAVPSTAYVIQRAGLYLALANIQWATPASTSDISARVGRYSSADVLQENVAQQMDRFSTSLTTPMSVAGGGIFAAGEKIKVTLRQESTAAQTLTLANLTIVHLGL